MDTYQSTRSAAALLDELQQLRLELTASRQELVQERAASRYLEDKLALSESDFMKATTQIIDLRSLIATTESDDGEEGWSQKSAPWLDCADLRVTERHQEQAMKMHLPSANGCESKDEKDTGTGTGTGAGAGAVALKGRSACADDMLFRKTTQMTNLPADCIKKHRILSAQHTGIQRKLSKGLESAAGAGAGTGTGTVCHREKGLLTDMDICIAIFEKNLAGLRSRLVKGMKVHLWEEGSGCHVHNFECLVTLDRGFEVLSFVGCSATRRSTFSMFSQKVEVDPIR